MTNRSPVAEVKARAFCVTPRRLRVSRITLPVCSVCISSPSPKCYRTGTLFELGNKAKEFIEECALKSWSLPQGDFLSLAILALCGPMLRIRKKRGLRQWQSVKRAENTNDWASCKRKHEAQIAISAGSWTPELAYLPSQRAERAKPSCRYQKRHLPALEQSRRHRIPVPYRHPLVLSAPSNLFSCGT
jgi:hypothetical protein